MKCTVIKEDAAIPGFAPLEECTISPLAYGSHHGVPKLFTFKSSNMYRITISHIDLESLISKTIIKIEKE